MRRVTVPLLMALTLVAAVLVPASSAGAMAKIKCKETVAVANVDPIVDHDKVGPTMHTHQFFGNNAWLRKGNSANYADLVGKGTNCRNAADTSAYWTPVLRYKSGPRQGQRVPVRAFTAYYRPYTGVGSKTGVGRPYPADTRLVASAHDWGCGDKSGVKLTQTIPSCLGQSGKPGHTLTAHINFPSCWDGVLPNHRATDVGDTRDNAHYAYRVRSGRSWVCPKAFPVQMVALQETLQFTYTGAGQDVELSSDAMMGTTDGASLHGDFLNAWVQPGFESMVRNCVNAGGRYTAAECG